MSKTAEQPNHDLDLEQLHDVLQRLLDGDFSARLRVTWRGRAGAVARVFNTLMERMEILSSEYIRITGEVGKQGWFGGQAEVDGLAGRWREMHESLNYMSAVLTEEVRRTSTTAQAWADGDATQRLDAGRIPGEVAQMQQRLDAAAKRWGGGSTA